MKIKKHYTKHGRKV